MTKSVETTAYVVSITESRLDIAVITRYPIQFSHKKKLSIDSQINKTRFKEMIVFIVGTIELGLNTIAKNKNLPHFSKRMNLSTDSIT